MLKLSDRVQRVRTSEGISLSELEYMVEHSAITSRPGANRRFHHWLFLVEDNEVLEMKGVDQPGEGDHEAPCSSCNGEGGICCNWWGTIRFGN